MRIISKIRDWIKSHVSKCEYYDQIIYQECDHYNNESFNCNDNAGVGCGRWRIGLIKK